MGLFQHFPYTNFHDLNLDVILKRTEEAEASAASSASDAAQAAANAQSAVTTANQALTQANAAQTTANNALTTANEALAAANKTVITVNCDATNNTAELVSDLTFEQIIEAAQQNNILLRLSLSTDSDNVYRQLVYPTLQYFSVQD